MTTYKITKEMTVGELFEVNPNGQELLGQLHIGGCHNCAIDENDTIEKLARDNALDINQLLNSLNQ